MHKAYIVPVLVVLAAAFVMYSGPSAESNATTLADASALKVQVNPANSVAPAVKMTGCEQTYVVAKGESLASIAQTFYRDPQAYRTLLAATNNAAKSDPSFAPIASPGAVNIGQKLCVTQAPQVVTQQAEIKTITGTVTYEPAATLPGTAMITIQLRDLFGIITETAPVQVGNQYPITFELSYMPAQIIPDNTYNVFVKITVDGVLTYVSTQPCYVLTKRRPTSNLKIALSAATGAAANRITGNLTYGETPDVARDLFVTVQLIDITRQATGEMVRGEHSFTTNGQPKPIPFEIKYNPATIRTADNYIVRATITVDGKVWFTTTSNYLVLTQGRAKTVDVPLTKVN